MCVKEIIDINSYLENSFNLSATNQKGGTCAFTSNKYLQHLIVITSIIPRLKGVKVSRYGGMGNKIPNCQSYDNLHSNKYKMF
jgi:hypothetical protein